MDENAVRTLVEKLKVKDNDGKEKGFALGGYIIHFNWNSYYFSSCAEYHHIKFIMHVLEGILQLLFFFFSALLHRGSR